MSYPEEDRGAAENLTKKILTLGLGAYFLTEDTVRRYVKDAKIPRDIARSITQNASKGKEELYGYVARELSSFLRQMDLQEELDRFVKSHKIRVSAEIEFMPRGGAAQGEGEGEEGEGAEPDADEPPIEWDLKFRHGDERPKAEEPEPEPEPPSEEAPAEEVE